MGFRIVAANGGATFGNPVGLDGVFEASCPPYHPTMDAAVDAVLAPPLPGSKATGPVPHRMSEAEHRVGAIRISAEGLACTKAICNYIHDTYGRFPGGTDAMHLMWVMQAHHIDTAYYDRFFGAGAYRPEIPRAATLRRPPAWIRGVAFFVRMSRSLLNVPPQRAIRALMLLPAACSARSSFGGESATNPPSSSRPIGP